ncbi:MAG: response regulator transcription factor [Labedaea sp.]
MPVTPSEFRRGPRKVVIRFADPLLRDTVASWVDSLPGYQVAGAVEGAAALIKLCTVRPPDVAVVQVRSAERIELSLIAELCCVRPGPHVVGLHQALDPASLLRLHRAGANRLVSSRLGLPALRAALGEPDDEPAGRPGRGALSERELEILALLSAGCSVADIASALEISAHTVANHKRHIFTKLNVHSRAQAVAQVGRLGLVRGPLEGRRSDRVVVVDRQPDHRSAVVDALRRGAGAVLADADVAELLPAVNALVRAGYLVAAEEVMRDLLAGAAATRPHLTRREREILNAVARGRSVAQTAAALGVAVKTVQSQHRQLFAKLGARNRVAALARARQLGLVER